MRNLILILFIMSFLASPAFAGDDYVQYDLKKLAKKSEQRLKEISKMAEAPKTAETR